MNSCIKIARRGLLAVAAGALVAFAAPVHAQDDYPNKTIEVVIHSAFGGGTDITARTMIIDTSKNLGVDMVVASHRGGSGAKAQSYVLSKPADGYTIMALTQSHLYTMARGKSDMKIDDIIGVARAMDDPTFVAVSANGPFKTMEDLVKVSKERPLNWGVAQIGGTEHIGLAQLSKAAGMQYKVVPFGSGGQMVQALLSGAIDATVPNVSEAGGQIADGTIRALAVMAEERLDDYPDVRTTFEMNYPVKTSTTRGYAVRADTPKEIVDKLSAAMVEGMNGPVFASYLKSSGLNPKTSVAGSEVWDKQLKEEYKTAVEAMKELGLL